MSREIKAGDWVYRIPSECHLEFSEGVKYKCEDLWRATEEIKIEGKGWWDLRNFTTATKAWWRK